MGRKRALTPPHSLEAEQSLIGSLMLAPKRFSEVAGMIGPEDAYDVRHRLILSELFAMQADGLPLDQTILITRLKATERFDEAGGKDYIRECFESVPIPSRLLQFADIVATKSKQRRLIEVGHQLMQLGHNDELALKRNDDWLTTAGNLVRGVIEDRPRKGSLGSQPVMISMADVVPEEVHWLWQDRIALGKLTMLVGDPGLGKSFLTIDLAARVSLGVGWPDNPEVKAPRGDVVLLNAEDGLADTVRPRLDRHGADVRRIVALTAVRNTDDAERPFDLTRDLPALEAAVKSMPECRLVIVDPVTAYLGGTDHHSNGEVRDALMLLVGLASRYNVAVVCVTHLNKNSAGPAIYRATGALSFTAVARTVYAVSKNVDDPQRRLVLPVKNNLGNDSNGLAYSINDGKVCWERDPVTMTADEALANNTKRLAAPSKVDDAGTWLAKRLQAGPVPAKEIIAEAEALGIAEKTLQRASREIEVVKNKLGSGGWEWSLPQDGQLATLANLSENDQKPSSFPEDGQDCQISKVATLLDIGHLPATTNEWGTV